MASSYKFYLWAGVSYVLLVCAICNIMGKLQARSVAGIVSHFVTERRFTSLKLHEGTIDLGENA